ncbi:MAG: condensin subunit ScpB [Tardiphaga sp.]|nr:condensin subunit ScpB [Tardiphaga sp.]
MASLAEKRIVEVEDHEQQAAAQARPEELRLLEALLFASTEPLDTAALAKRMPDGVDVKAALLQLQADYAMRGVNLVRVASKWSFRTAGDLAWLMTRESTETRRLSRAAIEMLAIIAYHQPVTRAEIEDIRGVVTSKGTLDVLLETGWIKPRGRRKTPGRPLTFGTTEAFLSQFSLEALGDLPGLEELKGTGLLDSRLPGGFSVPTPSDDPTLREDEDPLEDGELDLSIALEPEFPGLSDQHLIDSPTADASEGDPKPKPKPDEAGEEDPEPDAVTDEAAGSAAFAEAQDSDEEDEIDGVVDAEPDSERAAGVEREPDPQETDPDGDREDKV